MRYRRSRRDASLHHSSLSLIRPSDLAILAVQDLNECLSEFNIEGGVYDRIYSTIDVAQPSKSIIHLSRNLAFGAVGVQDMRNEKRQPAYDEYT